MTMLLDGCSAPVTTKHAHSNDIGLPVALSDARGKYKRLETQAARTRQAVERLHRSETKLKTNATQILLAILRYAAAQDDPAD